ncbi:MAG: hypothetical protein ABIP88_12475 [Candidatus Binatia bacterium]
MKNNKVEFLVGAIFAMASFSMAFPLRNGVGAFLTGLVGGQAG